MKVIMYHYVRMSDKNFPFFRYLSVENFCKQLEWLKSKFGLISFDEFVNLANDPRKYFASTKHKVLLTFDDGFIDHYKYVLPQLKKHNAVGLFFVPTGIYENKKALDVHRIHHLLGMYNGGGGGALLDFANSIIKDEMLEYVEKFKPVTYKNQSNEQCVTEFKKLFNYYIKYDFREKLLDEIVSHFSNDDEIFQNLYMNEQQLREMHSQNMIIGSHSVSHLVFSKLNEANQTEQIVRSFDFLQNILGDFHIKTFCYPYGGFHTFTDFTESVLQKNSCKFAFNVESRDTSLNDLINRPQALPRYDCNEFEFGKASMG